MLPDIQRTIVALASAARPSERAIVRLAGPTTRQILGLLCENLRVGFLDASSLQWCDCLCSIPVTQSQLPITLLYWPDDRSYTGSPAAEIHLIGSLPLAEAVIQRCCELGAEPAGRGEFTLRAFLAGKLDLAQAEAVLGVIEADSQQSLTIALGQLGGNLAPAIEPLRAGLVDVLAELEAGLDFVDEDIQFISNQQVIAQLQKVNQQLEEFATRLDTRSSTDRVPKVVLTGLPNSGKSSLFNAICQQSLAIVADVPGTTRDYLQHRVTLPHSRGKLSFDLVDTAGWEELNDTTPRAMAQQQLSRCLQDAQLILLCIEPAPLSETTYWQELAACSSDGRWMIVVTKRDLLSSDKLEATSRCIEQARAVVHASRVVQTCCEEVDSIDKLVDCVAEELNVIESRVHSGAGPLAIVHETAVRCRAALAAARSGLAAALEMAEADGGEELIAAELRLVLDDLATIIGEVHSDDVLGNIFARFCIGK